MVASLPYYCCPRALGRTGKVSSNRAEEKKVLEGPPPHQGRVGRPLFMQFSWDERPSIGVYPVCTGIGDPSTSRPVLYSSPKSHAVSRLVGCERKPNQSLPPLSLSATTPKCNDHKSSRLLLIKMAGSRETTIYRSGVAYDTWNFFKGPKVFCTWKTDVCTTWNFSRPFTKRKLYLCSMWKKSIRA